MTTRLVDVTLLVCTFNRSSDLRDLLETALQQQTDGSFNYEVLVVDNNSNDDTRHVVDAFVRAGHENLRYVFEQKQGKSHALNAGLAAARGAAYVITDDDFVLPPDWVSKIVGALRRYRDASFVSGKVLPSWQAAVPTWLTHEHWSALALTDYGDDTFVADATRPVCLLACAFRKADVDAVGGYRGDLGVSAGAIGGVEDLEILQRLWRSGRRGVYLPDLFFHHKVQPGRLTKRYHRRWHTGHGRFYAALRDPDFERSSLRLFDIPTHVYGAAARHLGKWLLSAVAARHREAFSQEVQLRFLIGFALARRRQFVTSGGDTLADLLTFTRKLLISQR